MAKPILSLIERFESKFIPEPNSGCWLWTGSIDSGGYGHFKLGPKAVLAHRASYRFYVGDIPKPFLDHKCSNRCCVNPDHLEPVTAAENDRRTRSRGRGFVPPNPKANVTHCPSGHPYTGDNVFFVPSSKARRCRECARARQRGK